MFNASVCHHFIKCLLYSGILLLILQGIQIMHLHVPTKRYRNVIRAQNTVKFGGPCYAKFHWYRLEVSSYDKAIA